MPKEPDVWFVFEDDDEIVKLAAHKDVLASASPAFDAMFNGDLKEQGDVHIVDVSPAAFEMFLHLIYKRNVELSLDYIAEVLKLIDKYDVIICIPECVHFLKKKLAIENMFWGLHLAVTYHIDGLKAFCLNKIRKNFNRLWTCFDIKDNDEVKLSAKSTEFSHLTDEDMEVLFEHLFAISNDIITSLANKMDCLLRKSGAFPITLSSIQGTRRERSGDYEAILVSLSEPMLLTDILCSKIPKCVNGRRGNKIEKCILDISIEEKSNFHIESFKMLYKTRVLIKRNRNQVELSPIVFKPNYVYEIYLKSDLTNYDLIYTFNSTALETEVELTPGVNILFPLINGQSLIFQLYFSHSSR